MNIEQDKQDLASDDFELRLAREVRGMDTEIQPSRDLWLGIERNMLDFPQQPATKTTWQKISHDWMPYGIAASLVLALSSLLLNFTTTNQTSGLNMVAADQTITAMDAAYLPVRNPLVDKFNETNKSLPPAALEDLYKNIEIMANARRDIEMAVREEPNNQRLVDMLMRIHEQELELLKQDYSAQSRSL